jgi:hypothetical protein
MKDHMQLGEPFVLDLDEIAKTLYRHLIQRAREIAPMIAARSPVIDELAPFEREALRAVAEPVVQFIIREYVEHAARFSTDEWAARYKALLAVTGNARLALNVESVMMVARHVNEVSGAPFRLVVGRSLEFMSLLAFGDDLKRLTIYPNHAEWCEVNNLTVDLPCNCGEAERLVAKADERAAVASVSNSELRDIFRRIAAGEGGHGGFVRDFAAAFARADQDNMTLMRSVALALIEKYDLHESLKEVTSDEEA